MAGLDASFIITTIIAVYAASLSTILAIFQMGLSRPKVEVRFSRGIRGVPGEYASPALLMWDIINKGSVDVTVNSIYIRLPDGRSLNMPRLEISSPMPALIKGQSRCEAWIEEQVVKDGLKRNGYTGNVGLLGCAGTAAGRTYQSKKFTIQV